MRLFSIKTGDKILRVREEDFGCAILDRENYVEGNKTVYRVLELLSQGKTLKETINIFAEAEDVPREKIREDVLSLMKMFNELGWFLELTEEGE